MELVISELKANDLHDTGAAYDKQDPAVFIRVGSVTQSTARQVDAGTDAEFPEMFAFVVPKDEYEKDSIEIEVHNLNMMKIKKAFIGKGSIPIKKAFPEPGKPNKVSVPLTVVDPKNGNVQKGRIIMTCVLNKIGTDSETSTKQSDAFGTDRKVKAIGFRSYGHADQLQDVTIPAALLGVRDLRVSIKAVSVNPVDAKIRRGDFGNNLKGDEPIVLGYDGAGIVLEVGSETRLFKVGDRVMFAGALNRQGTNAELTVVDERLVGRVPEGVEFAVAAAIPLTGLTAWEGLVEQLGLKPYDFNNRGKKLLVLPANGGVGNVVVQLAAKVLGLEVIAVCSNENDLEPRNLGAKHVISYKRQLKPQLEKLDIHGVDYIFNGYDTSVYLDQYVEIINHYGKIVSIVNNNQPLNLGPLMMKRVSFSWELMFTRALVGGEDMINQHYILDTLAQLVECGLIRVKIDQQLHFNVANLRSAHQMIEGGHTHGKIVLFR